MTDTLDEILDTVLAKVGIDFSKDEEIKAEAKAQIKQLITEAVR